MTSETAHVAGRHFLQIPGPSNVPDAVLRAMAQPVIDHRGPDFPALTFGLLEKLARVFATKSSVFIFPASGTGAWECALLNALSPGDRVLAFETGHFATLWKDVAEKIGLQVQWLEADWRRGVNPGQVEEILRTDSTHSIKAVLAVHTETSTGVTSRIPLIREAIDNAGHPTLFMVDAVSSLACSPYRHDDWRVDVAVSASQKGLMLPPGLAFNAVSDKALKAATKSSSAHSYWRWDSMLANNKKGYFPYTPATNLLYGLDTALELLLKEGLDNVIARHSRLAAATRQALAVWDLENVCLDPEEYCNSTTAIMVPAGFDADALRNTILERFNMSLGTGLGKLKGRVFRIGHLGDFNDLMLVGALGGVEMGLAVAGIPYRKGGVTAALDYLGA